MIVGFIRGAIVGVSVILSIACLRSIRRERAAMRRRKWVRGTLNEHFNWTVRMLDAMNGKLDLDRVLTTQPRDGEHIVEALAREGRGLIDHDKAA